MSVRVAPLLVVLAAALPCMGGCTSSTKLSDLWASKGTDAGNAATADAAGAADAKINDPSWPKLAAAAQPPAGGDITGTTVVQPAEPGPTGEPIATMSKPGLLGDDPHDDVQLGKKYFRSNNFALAEKSFRDAVEKHPRDAEAWVGLAASYDRLHRFDLADRAYAEAIRIVGRTPEILNNQGFSYMLRGDYARARKTLSDAQAKDPGNPYIQANLRLLADSYREGKAVQ
jgi:tetratricopeptide (TPR) repeat protein